MAPHDLTPAEIAQLLAPVNHPSPLSVDELEQLVGHLNDEQMEELVDLMGLGTLARQLPPVLLKIDTIIRNLDLVEISDSPPSSPAPPCTPVKAQATPKAHTTPKAHATPSTLIEISDSPPSLPEFFHTHVKAGATLSTPTTPTLSSSCAAGYTINSPIKIGRVVTWFEAGALTQGVAGASATKVHTGKSRPSTKHGAYVVFYGCEVAVFQRWPDAQRSITGAGLAIHAGYPSMEAGLAALDYARSMGWTADSTSAH
ncbi:hypothetical protein B0H13DRAFT_2339549, partial [Mycena leptocephala]